MTTRDVATIAREVTANVMGGSLVRLERLHSQCSFGYRLQIVRGSESIL
jgi:hypothetical protein